LNNLKELCTKAKEISEAREKELENLALVSLQTHYEKIELAVLKAAKDGYRNVTITIDSPDRKLYEKAARIFRSNGFESEVTYHTSGDKYKWVINISW
jgi:hypothetical protein